LASLARKLHCEVGKFRKFKTKYTKRAKTLEQKVGLLESAALELEAATKNGYKLKPKAQKVSNQYRTCLGLRRSQRMVQGMRREHRLQIHENLLRYQNRVALLTDKKFQELHELGVLGDNHYLLDSKVTTSQEIELISYSPITKKLIE